MRPARLIICEGSYSLHSLYASVYDLKVFLTCDAEEQNRRILERNGKMIHARFVREWIPMENRYIEAFGIRESCDTGYFLTGTR